MAANDTITTQEAQDAANAIKSVENVVTHPDAASIAAAAGTVGPLVEDAPQIIEETRRGWKTTEFWTSLGVIAADLGLDITSKEKAIISGIAAIYALARGIAKHGVPNIRPFGT